jgi:hypothetical protein
MRQILLDEQTLRAGLDASATPTPDTPVAVVAATPDQLAAPHGFELQRAYDDLGRLVLAVIETGEGTRFTLERHDHDPLRGTTVSLFEGDVTAERVREVLDELHVAPRQIVWLYPDQARDRSPRRSPGRWLRLVKLASLVSLVRSISARLRGSPPARP